MKNKLLIVSIIGLGLMSGVQAKSGNGNSGNKGNGNGHSDKEEHGGKGKGDDQDHDGKGDDRTDKDHDRGDRDHDGDRGWKSDKDHGRGNREESVENEKAEQHERDGDRGWKADKHHPRLTNAEQQAVQDYIDAYRQREGVRSLPPGLAKKVARGEELPPGWQKKIARGEVLPVIVYQQISPLPRRLRIQLPEQPVGTRLGLLDGNIIRVVDATRTIVDVLNIH